MTDVEAETPIFWPPDAKIGLIWKDSDAEKDWGWEEKGTTEDEMVGWHHQRDAHEFEWTLRVDDGQQDLACSQARLSDWTELKEGQLTNFCKTGFVFSCGPGENRGTASEGERRNGIMSLHAWHLSAFSFFLPFPGLACPGPPVNYYSQRGNMEKEEPTSPKSNGRWSSNKEALNIELKRNTDQGRKAVELLSNK